MTPGRLRLNSAALAAPRGETRVGGASGLSRREQRRAEKKRRDALRKLVTDVEEASASAELQGEADRGNDRALSASEFEALDNGRSAGGPDKTDDVGVERVLTAAERAHAPLADRQMREVAKQLATQSHKEKVGEYNEYLGNLGEIHDIPKVGPG